MYRAYKKLRERLNKMNKTTGEIFCRVILIIHSVTFFTIVYGASNEKDKGLGNRMFMDRASQVTLSLGESKPKARKDILYIDIWKHERRVWSFKCDGNSAWRMSFANDGLEIDEMDLNMDGFLDTLTGIDSETDEELFYLERGKDGFFVVEGMEEIKGEEAMKERRNQLEELKDRTD